MKTNTIDSLLVNKKIVSCTLNPGNSDNPLELLLDDGTTVKISAMMRFGVETVLISAKNKDTEVVEEVSAF